MCDISMCEGNECPLKQRCYRFTAIPNEYRQSYFIEPPYIDDECDYFWDIDNNEKQIEN